MENGIWKMYGEIASYSAEYTDSFIMTILVHLPKNLLRPTLHSLRKKVARFEVRKPRIFTENYAERKARSQIV